MLSRRSQQSPHHKAQNSKCWRLKQRGPRMSEQHTHILEPSRRLSLHNRSNDMRSENAIMTSRREFLSDALGIGLVTASTWPIRADEARSIHGQSNSSTRTPGPPP